MRRAAANDAPDTRPARTRGALFLGHLLSGQAGKQKEVTRPKGRNALALDLMATSDKRQATSDKKRDATSQQRPATSASDPLPDQSEVSPDTILLLGDGAHPQEGKIISLVHASDSLAHERSLLTGCALPENGSPPTAIGRNASVNGQFSPARGQ